MAQNEYRVEFTESEPENEKYVVVLPTTRNTETNLTLLGRGLPLYGKDLNENLLHLLENFASPEDSSGSPSLYQPDPTFVESKAIKGQLWFNTTTSSVNVFDGNEWQVVGSVPVGSTEPGTVTGGSLWFDTSIEQLKVYFGGSWVSVADRYVLKSGDTMSGTLMIDVPSSTISDIYMTGHGHIGAAQDVRISMDHANDTVGDFVVSKGPPTSRVEIFTVENSGHIFSNITNYETLVTTNNSIPNKKYVDDNNSLKVSKSGDTMTGGLNMGSNQINFSALVVGGFGGNANAGPDIYSTNADDLSLGSGASTYIIVDTNNNGGGQFNVRRGHLSSSVSTPLFTVTNAGRIQSEVGSYETLVTTNNSIPNKKYVDTAITTALGSVGSSVFFHPAPVLIQNVNVGTSNLSNVIQTKQYVWGWGAPVGASHALIRFRVLISRITDLRRLFVTLNGYHVLGTSSDDTDQGGLQDANGLSEVWVPVNHNNVSLTYTVFNNFSGAEIRIQAYRIGYAT